MIEAIKQQVISCTKCSLCNTRTNSVPGKGDHNADVMFIGEAPGRNEDKKGEPFVGIAGSRLTEALNEIGVTRDSVYITNVVKCRPPKNRVPTKDERDACSKYLEMEISAIKPKIICIMGNTAFNSILDGTDITRNRGKVIKKNNHLYYTTVHPAATIYNRELIKVLKSDIKKLFSMVQELKDGKKITIDIEYTC